MKTTLSLGVGVLCCCVLAALTEALDSVIHGGTEKQQQQQVKPNEEDDQQQQQFHQHQHEKRATATNAALTLEVLERLANADLQQQQQHLRGRRLPLYVDEPRFILLRQRTPPSASQLTQFPAASFSFIPQRGRKSDPQLEKRELSIKQMLAGGDYFVPNRGKKGAGGITKKVKFDDILGQDELFIPNRGKKELLELLGGAGGRGFNELQPYYSKKNVLNAIQNVGGKGALDASEDGELFYPTRGKKNVLDNLAQSQDTFFSSRGKRLPVAWTSSQEQQQLIPWEYLVDDSSSLSSSYDVDYALDRYQTNKIIT